MNQNTKTMLFLVAAMASVGIAAGMHFSNQPASLDDFSDVGEQFYPKFTDPNEATSLRVAAYNKETGKTDLFNVEFKNGLWRIPSHHGYPADGQDRLSKVAASMIGVNRQALVERSATAHKRYNLIDPLDQKASGVEGRGDRITLTKGDEPLVDFIVGKKVEGKEHEYYVRRADEDRFYTADLGNFQVSTKFGDWIKKDVLDVSRSSIIEIDINHSYVDEAKGRVVAGETIRLTRASANADWEMEGLNLAEDKVKTTEVNNLLGGLDDLQIVGVRPKPPAFINVLKGEGAQAIDVFTERELQEKGFFIGPRGELISNEGEVSVGTKEGVFYSLRFGEEFSGSEMDIEVGAAKPAEESKGEKPTDKDPADQTKSTDSPKDADKPEEENADKKTNSRYLMVTVHFEQELLGPTPVAPTKPEPPAATEAPKTEPVSDDNAKTEQKADGETQPADSSESKETKPAEAAKPDPKAEYEAALKNYQEEQEVYELKKKDYDEKVKAGQERVAELNRRFADWYYVISEDAFDRLKLKRSELIEKAAPAKTIDPNAAGGDPFQGLMLPGQTAPAAEPAAATPVEPMKEAPAADTAPAAPAAAATEKEEIAPAKPAEGPATDDKKGTPAADGDKTKPEEKPATPATEGKPAGDAPPAEGQAAPAAPAAGEQKSSS
ncbi:DUF4340 domain-containing protein [Planctomicrobium sp. SH664]|uniref:DUF4340 domain-containing protein n=1 Tax=Planctomicrobium sp. SH664 TaxID=3448125 RepID=UPI003F5C9DD5